MFVDVDRANSCMLLRVTRVRSQVWSMSGQKRKVGAHVVVMNIYIFAQLELPPGSMVI